MGRLAERVDSLLEFDAAELSDDELSDAVVELQRQSERLAAARAALVSVWDARQSWAADGARTGAAWLAAKCRMSKRSARREVRRARALRHMPVASEALAAGEIGVDHLDALSRVRRDHLAECFARAERQLVGHTKRLPFHHFHKTVRYWEQLADPDGVEDRAAKRYADRGAHLSKTFDGTQALDALFDVVGGAEFAAVFDSIEKELFDADWAEAKATYGDDVSLDKLARTPAQRRAATTPKDGQRPRFVARAIIDFNTLWDRICELSDGTVLTPGEAARIITRADIERVVFDTPSRVIDISAKQRLFTGATRRAVEVRDRECWHDTCDEPAEHCDIDHIQRFEHGGPTTQTNGRPACPYHNPGRRRPKTPRGP